MGEKIKDIHPIRVGRMSCMVELNEGYSSRQGRTIHIQNDKFRYLLKEKDFFHFASATLFAWDELNYVKEHFGQKQAELSVDKNDHDVDTLIAINDIVHLFSSINIAYRILKIEGDVVTVIVENDNIDTFRALLEKKGAKSVSHPFGKTHGYVFLYQMTPFFMYEIKGYHIEVFCQLPCASTTSKTWMPLHKSIQMEVWNDCKDEGGLKWCNANCQYIYILSRAILQDRKINLNTIKRLDTLWNQLDLTRLHDLLSVVYFKFTDSLIQLLQSREYDKIVPSYYGFLDY